MLSACIQSLKIFSFFFYVFVPICGWVLWWQIILSSWYERVSFLRVVYVFALSAHWYLRLLSAAFACVSFAMAPYICFDECNGNLEKHRIKTQLRLLLWPLAMVTRNARGFCCSLVQTRMPRVMCVVGLLGILVVCNCGRAQFWWVSCIIGSFLASDNIVFYSDWFFNCIVVRLVIFVCA